MRLLASLLVVLVCTLTLSCGGKKEVKKQSEDSRIATEAVDVAEKLRDAYLRKDLKSIERNTTREGYRTIVSSVKPFDHAELEFNPVWVEIEGNEVRLNVSWKGKWQKTGKTLDERGMAVFVMRGKPLKLENIIRGNPFVYPE